MRILKTVQAYFPFQDMGGPVVKVRAIATGLARRGHAVTVLTADLGLTAADAEKYSIQRVPRGWCRYADGVEAVYLATLARHRALTLNPGVLSFCAESLAGFDVVHVYGLYDLLGPAVARACRRRRVPYVIEPMGMFRPIIRNIALKRLYHRIFGGSFIRGAQYLIATSPQEKMEFTAAGIAEDRVVVRRNGVEVPRSLPDGGVFRSRWGIAEDARIVLFLGRVVSKKSPELLLEAFAGWRAESPGGKSAVLVLAGPEEGDGYYATLRALAGRLQLGESVLFTGPLYDEMKWAAYRSADVFVLPSRHENFGNTAAEAVACGTPVILTECCGIAPLLDQRAGLAIPHDAQALRVALALVLENDALRRRLRAGTVAVARELSWDPPLSQMEGLYSQLMAGAASS